jgi:hypothetical protein
VAVQGACGDRQEDIRLSAFFPLMRATALAREVPMNIRAFARCAYGLGASAAILAGASASAMAGAAAPITYYISDAILGLTFAGTITTDGTIGVLAKKNILNWSVTVSEFGGGGYTFSKSSGGTLSVAGRDLTASATSISFNFGDNNPATAGSFLFSDSTHSAFAGSSEFVFCSTYSYCGGTGQEGGDFKGTYVAFAYPTAAEIIAYRYFWLRPFPWPFPWPFPRPFP